MNRTVGLTLRRTAGGGVIFAIGLSVLATRPQPPMPVLASTVAPEVGPDHHYVERPIRTVDSASIALSVPASPKPAAPAVATTAATITVRTARPAKVAAAPKAVPTPATQAAAAPPVNAAPGGGNAFSYGYCTWWVSQKRAIPWRGNAAAWWWNARAFGFAEGSAPRVGAIMVMGAGGAASSSGHVGYVEAVNADGSFLISEMNWWGVPGGGWGKVDYRTVRSMRGILGFIY